ncbi:MAG: hypothetical protein Q7K43_03475 [Candidatus Woesearchaeota archaeon]|nr:hypothetical protein [Candidatus Woesearchaeota archaeon]
MQEINQKREAIIEEMLKQASRMRKERKDSFFEEVSKMLEHPDE